jgi:hypothetical protein
MEMAQLETWISQKIRTMESWVTMNHWLICG